MKCCHLVTMKTTDVTGTFSEDEPSDVSSPSLPSSQGFRTLGFFFRLLLSPPAVRRSASGLRPSAAAGRSSRWRKRQGCTQHNSHHLDHFKNTHTLVVT